MRDIILDILIKNPLTVSLVILGVICVVLSIVGQIPPMDIRGWKAVLLAGFGFFLIFLSVGLSWILAASTVPTTSPPTPTPAEPPTQVFTATSQPTTVPTNPPTQVVTPTIRPQVTPLPQDPYNCKFINELVNKGQINLILMGGKGPAGVQILLNESVDVPLGWTVHREGVEYKGPVHFDAGTFASFWAPDPCEPLSINP